MIHKTLINKLFTQLKNKSNTTKAKNIHSTSTVNIVVASVAIPHCTWQYRVLNWQHFCELLLSWDHVIFASLVPMQSVTVSLKCYRNNIENKTIACDDIIVYFYDIANPDIPYS